MTIFTVNYRDDGYFDGNIPARPFQKICFRTWKDTGEPVKVFDSRSQEVIRAKEIFSEYLLEAEKKSIALCSDPVKLYICSLYPEYLYLDTDVYLNGNVLSGWLSENENGKDFCTRGSSFYCIWSGKEKKRDLSVLNKYIDFYRNWKKGAPLLQDKEVQNLLGKAPQIPKLEGWGKHIPYIDHEQAFSVLYAGNMKKSRPCIFYDDELCPDDDIKAFQNGKSVRGMRFLNMAGIRDKNDRKAVMEIIKNKNYSYFKKK